MTVDIWNTIDPHIGVTEDETTAAPGPEDLVEMDSETDEEDPRQEIQRDLAAFAKTTAHTATHKPALPKYCETCRIAKAKHARKLKGKSTRKPEKYGDIITMDHTKMQDVSYHA